MKKAIWIISLLVLLVLSGVVLLQVLFCIWRGCQSRRTQLYGKKRVVFKTYEGKLIQSGFVLRVKRPVLPYNPTNLNSVENEGIADALMLSSGKDSGIALQGIQICIALAWFQQV